MIIELTDSQAVALSVVLSQMFFREFERLGYPAPLKMGAVYLTENEVADLHELQAVLPPVEL